MKGSLGVTHDAMWDGGEGCSCIADGSSSRSFLLVYARKPATKSLGECKSEDASSNHTFFSFERVR